MTRTAPKLYLPYIRQLIIEKEKENETNQAEKLQKQYTQLENNLKTLSTGQEPSFG